MRVCLVQLGCPKNRVDGEVMLGQLGLAGHAIAATPDLADLVLVNTCGFVLDAQRESVETILQLAARKRRGHFRFLVAAGCLAQRDGPELLTEIPELDAVLGTGAVGETAGLVERLLDGDESSGRPDLSRGPAGYLERGVVPRLLTTAPWTAYLKISEGCDNRCRYCVIPDLRGPHRSRLAQDVLEEASQLAAGGSREIVLVGQDLTRWGEDLPPGEASSLSQLIPRLCAVGGLDWLRMHYLHPARVTPSLLESIAGEPKACRYLDLPVQHGDDGILAAMGRGVTAGQMLSTAELARTLMPDVAIRTSYIVGFPGETAAAFDRLLSFARAFRADWAGVFPYSREAGTPAAGLAGQIPGRVKSVRRGRLMTLQRRISASRNQRLLGRTISVLVEGLPGAIDLPSGGQATALAGRSWREAPEVDGTVHVVVDNQDRAPNPGDMVAVRIIAAGPYDLYGRIE